MFGTAGKAGELMAARPAALSAARVGSNLKNQTQAERPVAFKAVLFGSKSRTRN